MVGVGCPRIAKRGGLLVDTYLIHKDKAIPE